MQCQWVVHHNDGSFTGYSARCKHLASQKGYTVPEHKPVNICTAHGKELVRRSLAGLNTTTERFYKEKEAAP